MKYSVKVQGRRFEVFVENIHTQPVIATVDGEEIEVWVDNHLSSTVYVSDSGDKIAAGVSTLKSLPASTENGGSGKSATGEDLNFVRAPIPGVILSIAVLPGTEVSTGQDLCILEAMKMKNVIRSPRNGIVSTIHVSAGQAVQHHDILIEFSD